MILKDGRKMTLKIENLGKNGRMMDRETGGGLTVLTIPFVGSLEEAEREIEELGRLAHEAVIISSHENNVHTNPPEGRVGKRLRYTWRFVGARSHVAEFVKNILCQ